MYNLTDQQRDALKWIVQKVHDGILPEEFIFVQLLEGWDIVGVDNIDFSTAPHMSKGMLDALNSSGLILVTPVGKSTYRVTLLGKANDAVDSNFDEISEVPNIPFSNSIFGQPDKKYTYDLFMLMPFAPELKPIYDDHIKKVAYSLSLSITRADDFFSPTVIMQDIWSAIFHTSILIADCTGKNPNVFYEIGIAHALNKPVILITQNPDDVPFDLRHRRYIHYDLSRRGFEKFEHDLTLSIQETQKDLSASG
jgi:hypothetical protein